MSLLPPRKHQRLPTTNTNTNTNTNTTTNSATSGRTGRKRGTGWSLLQVAAAAARFGLTLALGPASSVSQEQLDAVTGPKPTAAPAFEAAHPQASGSPRPRPETRNRAVDVVYANGTGSCHADGSYTNVFLDRDRVYFALDHPWSNPPRLAEIARDPTPPASCIVEFPLLKRKFSISMSDVEVDEGRGLIFARVPNLVGPAVRFKDPASATPASKLSWHPDGALVNDVGVTLPARDDLANLQSGRQGVVTYAYDANSQAGDCGSLVHDAWGVIGVHSGGSRQRNFFYAPACYTGGAEQGWVRTVRSGVTLARSKLRTAAPRAGPHLAPPPTAAPAARQRRGPARPPPQDRFLAAHTRIHRNAVARAQAGETDNDWTKITGQVWPESGRRSTTRETLASGSAPSSDYYGAAQVDGSSATDYADMVVNPFGTVKCRAPDHNITPTGLTSFITTQTYDLGVVGLNGSQYGIFFGMNSRLGLVNSQPPLEPPSVSPTSSVYPILQKVYSYAPGPLMQPTRVSGAQILSTDNELGPWSLDYGDQQVSSVPWFASYRTLAMGIRVRVVGLPAGQFMAPGKIYFAQVRNDRSDIPTTEADFVNLERLKRASHVSLEAVRTSDSKTMFMVPDSVDKFNLSSTFYPPPGSYIGSAFGQADNVGIAIRRFPAYADFSVDPAPEAVICPYDGAAVPSGSESRFYRTTGAVGDASCADATSILICAIFGASSEEGSPSRSPTIEISWSTTVEFVPTTAAPGLVETKVELPSATKMDKILTACAVASGVRPLMIQAPGDVTASIGSSRVGESVVNKVVRRVERVGMPTTSEGWFDWLGKVDLNVGDWSLSNVKKSAPAAPAQRRPKAPKPKARRGGGW